MNYKLATLQDCNQIYTLVQETIQTIYPKYYPREVVDFFSNLHSKERIREAINNQKVTLFFDKDTFVGTGTIEENHITRVFVLPNYQKKGYGSFIMHYLEEKIAKAYDKAYLDASLPAVQFYERRGYITIKHETWTCENDVILVYGIMEKRVTCIS